MAEAGPEKKRTRPIDVNAQVVANGKSSGSSASSREKDCANGAVHDLTHGVRAESDARLVERTRRGDEDAFAELVSRHERKLIQVLARMVHDQELARDLAQETFWKVYNRLDRFDLTRRFGPWLFRVGLNLALDWLRKHPPAPMISIDRPFFSHSQSHHDSDPEHSQRYEPFDPDPRVREDLVQEVRFILEQIPLAYRTILILRDLEGFSSLEAASIVNRREGTIRWRLSKAREMFRILWEKRQRWDSGLHDPNADTDSDLGSADQELDWLAASDDDVGSDPELERQGHRQQSQPFAIETTTLRKSPKATKLKDEEAGT